MKANENKNTTKSARLNQALDGILIVLILIGMFYRFNWVNWNQDTQLHPDEYGLTNTLTSLKLPDSPAEYFNTRISPISPYDKYDLAGIKTSDGPDNRLRWGQWPIILIRAAAEASGNTSYGDLRLMGRSMSAAADFLSVILIYFIGKRLYGQRAGLLAAALASLAVMEIQQSHFMTVDNFGTFFCTLALYAAVRVAQQPIAVTCAEAQRGYRFNPKTWPWLGLFAVSFGMAMATKINLLPLAGMLAVAIFIGAADLKLRSQADLRRLAWIALAQLALAGLLSVLVFRVTQPMSFRAVTGDTSLLTWHLNQDWWDSMQVAQSESSGIGGGPPAEQWAARPALIFPLMNMVVWGMGLPLGLMAWYGFGRAAWQVGRRGKNWRAHALPLIWVGGYFLFMGTRWVKSIRYFLPIYPFLALLAAWALIDLWHLAAQRRGKRALAAGLAGVVLAGTLLYATVFVNAVYRQDHTRLQATEWIFENVPAPLMLKGASGAIPVGAGDGTQVDAQTPLLRTFRPPEELTLTTIDLNHVVNPGDQTAQLRLTLYPAEDESTPLLQVLIGVPAGSTERGQTVTADVPAVILSRDAAYTLKLEALDDGMVIFHQTVLANESWDEGLPVPFDGYDPFGSLYTGISIENRWNDDENKREMFLERLAQTDYIIVPSQRGVWSVARMQTMYPMTIDYYRALFGGQLGFELVAEFQSPFVFGPLQVSDVGGTLAWNKQPQLPLFNFNFFAAEEAFSVYDHPPVWIFKKTADFDIAKVAEILNQADLSSVVVQSPRDSHPAPIQ